jgi:protein-S-isoprenylcysteine O-methyltransferase Ste14
MGKAFLFQVAKGGSVGVSTAGHAISIPAWVVASILVLAAIGLGCLLWGLVRLARLLWAKFEQWLNPPQPVPA